MMFTDGRILLGTVVTIYSCELVEALSETGMDWLFFDMEHAALSFGEVQRMVMATRKPCLSFVRLPEASSVYVKKALDTGCDGIIVPQVNSPAIARQVVEAGRYAPQGSRSVGLGRATGYGAHLTSRVASDNGTKAIFLQIETREAVACLSEILDVPGFTGLFVGPYDLSGSLGVLGEVGHPRVQESVDVILAAARSRKIPCGIFVGSDAAVAQEAARGFCLIAVGSDILRLTDSCRHTKALPVG